jgi:histidinol phosphatase-like enzyme
MNIIFLDVDGVLNSEIFFAERIKNIKMGPTRNIDPRAIQALNLLCNKVNAKVVISSSWKSGGLIFMQDILKLAGATFDIIDITPDLRGDHCFRGNEIYLWIKENEKLLGKPYTDYHSYVIIDDDSDMLLWQRENFFQTDYYSGLTPNICYKITRFFEKINAI